MPFTGAAHALEELLAGALEGVTLAGENVLQKSNEHVPLLEGTLERSGKVDAEVDGGSAVAAISYNTPYDVAQHEDLTYRHTEGRNAKFLENAWNESRDQTLDIIAASMRKRTGG